MSECQMCHGEDATVLEFCDDCWAEMIAESNASAWVEGFNEYWEINNE